MTELVLAVPRHAGLSGVKLCGSGTADGVLEMGCSGPLGANLDDEAESGGGVLETRPPHPRQHTEFSSRSGPQAQIFVLIG